MYFGKNVQEAIAEYQSLDGIERDKLYSQVIHPALNKLVENIIHNRKLYEYGFDNYNSTKTDCVSYLTERLDRFDLSRKKKAFSYFNRVAINFLIANKIKHESVKSKKANTSEIDKRRHVVNEVMIKERREELSDFTAKWVEWGILNIDVLFKQKRNRKIAEAIFNLFKNCQSIDNYNKKSLYLLIREQIDVKTQYITDVMRYMKTLYFEMYTEYKQNDTRKWKYFLIKEDDDNI